MKAHISSRSTVEGLAFPDHIKSGIKSRHRRFDDDSPSLLRIYFLPFFIVIFAFILILKTASLQLIQGEYYKSLADNNRTRTIMIRAPRGIIFDRNNEPLVFNVPGFRKIVNGKIKLLSREEAMEFIAKGKKDLEVDSLRQYPYKDIFAHILGYIGQISEEELKNSSFADYQAGELIGKSGIEEKYESELKGIDGKQLVEVNAAGERIRTLGQVDPIPGKDITLTVDAKLQKAAFLALEKVEKGVVVVSNPKGEILAMVSKPSFDANLFTMGEKYSSSGDYKKLSDVLLDSDGQPLLNRAISGVYPPGSTFKIITAAAGLEEKKIDENFEVVDTGILKIGSFSFANWFFTQHGKTDGDVNVIKALARSNDIFFYKLAEIIGVDKISEMSKKFGLGAKLGIDLKGEAKGTVPSNEWKKKVIGEQWYLGDTYHYGIGQGYLLTTPLQVNALTQVIANGGSLYEPHLLKNQKSKIKNQKILSDKTLSLIRQGMVEACSEGGVAWPLFQFKVKSAKLKVDGKGILEAPISSGSADMKQVIIACKTGTAQHGGEKTLPHSWITLFAPAYNPEVIVTVLSESSGEGSNIAAPIAKKVLEAYFSGQ